VKELDPGLKQNMIKEMQALGMSTGWQSHTVRGSISGAIGKRLGLVVESTRTEEGERRYRITA
jgi:hypothetical protein